MPPQIPDTPVPVQRPVSAPVVTRSGGSVLPILLSILALLLSGASVALAVKPLMFVPESTKRAMRLVEPLMHFSDKQFDIIVSMADQGAAFGAAYLSEDMLKGYENDLKELKGEASGGNPFTSGQLGDARNAQRRSDVNTILNAVYQYAIDNNGELPAEITSSPTPICRSGVNVDCTGQVNLNVLTGSYLVAVPTDPQTATEFATHYTIYRDAVTRRVTVSAPDAEQAMVISVTR